MSDSQPALARLGGFSSRTVVAASTFALLALACAGTAVLASSGSTLHAPPPTAGAGSGQTGLAGPGLVVVDGPAGAWVTGGGQSPGGRSSQTTMTSGTAGSQALLVPAAETSLPVGGPPPVRQLPTTLLPVLPGGVAPGSVSAGGASSAGSLPTPQPLQAGTPASPPTPPGPPAPVPPPPPPPPPPQPPPPHPGPPQPVRPPLGDGGDEKPGKPGHPLPPVRPGPPNITEREAHAEHVQEHGDDRDHQQSQSKHGRGRTAGAGKDGEQDQDAGRHHDR